MASDGAQTQPRIIGLTGPIGCGKTTVGDLLLEIGARERIDADRVVHGLLGPHTRVTAAVASRFGRAILDPEGGVDRLKLASIVFSDDAALRDLEAITHPAVRDEIRTRLDAWRGTDEVIVLDAIKLLQSDLLPLCEVVWLVECEPAQQMDRLVSDRGMTEGAARARIAAQPSFDHGAVTAIIANSGTLAQLRDKVVAAWTAYRDSAAMR